MKIQAKERITIKNIEIGGNKTLICTPITSLYAEEFIKDIDDALLQNPDALEWRLDYFDNLSPDYVYHTLNSIKDKLSNTIFILTLRDNKEGGRCHLSQDDKISIIECSIKTGVVDIIDIEQIQGKDYIDKIKKMIVDTDIKLILSYHDFNLTPDKEDIIQKIKTALKLGADIPKVAYMPKSSEDVLRLLETGLYCKKTLKTLLITISMGNLGKISRVCAGQFGCDITFASFKNTTAPGQIEIGNLKKIRRYLSL